FMTPPPAGTSTLSLHDALPILRDGPGPLLFPGEGMLPPDRLQIGVAPARLRGLVLVEDVLRHAHEDVTARRRDELQDPLARRRRSEEHTSELQSRSDLVCRLLL